MNHLAWKVNMKPFSLEIVNESQAIALTALFNNIDYGEFKAVVPSNITDGLCQISEQFFEAYNGKHEVRFPDGLSFGLKIDIGEVDE